MQPTNRRSLALVRRAGFVREGYSRRYVRIAGRWRDHVRMALLVEDWRARRKETPMSTGGLPCARGARALWLHGAPSRPTPEDGARPSAAAVRDARGMPALEPGDRVEYAFESSEPVDFNVHYHEGKTVVMPVVRERTREDAGIYAAQIAHDYCLMWEPGPPVR